MSKPQPKIVIHNHFTSTRDAGKDMTKLKEVLRSAGVPFRGNNSELYVVERHADRVLSLLSKAGFSRKDILYNDGLLYVYA